MGSLCLPHLSAGRGRSAVLDPQVVAGAGEPHPVEAAMPCHRGTLTGAGTPGWRRRRLRGELPDARLQGELLSWLLHPVL